METTFFYFLAYIALLVAGGYAMTRKLEDTPTSALAKKTEDLNELTDKYNEAAKVLIDGYNYVLERKMELNQSVSSLKQKKIIRIALKDGQLLTNK